MLRTEFHYELPPELIAQSPPELRGDSRLLVMGQGGELSNRAFRDIEQLLNPGDLLVVNDTQVLPARLFATKETGGRVELLLERLLDHCEMLAQARASKPLREGGKLFLENDEQLVVLGKQGEFFHLRLESSNDLQTVLETVGHVPLPPYIERQDKQADRERYQTVYAAEPGAVAAPTAGLHFDHDLLRRLEQKEIQRTNVTLHVGAGTFKPVRVDDISEHRMHAERYSLSAEAADKINTTIKNGGRIVAVGTTTVRVLESVFARHDAIVPCEGETRLFITPGFRFQVVDALITNFHLPESTLLMMVCAFAGMQQVLDAYVHAVAQRYRFFSYGDAMFLQRSDMV